MSHYHAEREFNQWDKKREKEKKENLEHELFIKDNLLGTSAEENDPVNPNHYANMALSPVNYIMANEGDFTWCIGNVIKYVSRYKRKNGLEDLKKAKWYLERQIKELEKE